MYIRQWSAKYGIKSIIHTYFVNVAYVYGTYVHGAMGELRTYAEYEVATGYPGLHVAQLDASNLQGYVLFIGISWGMLATWVAGRRKREVSAR